MSQRHPRENASNVEATKPALLNVGSWLNVSLANILNAATPIHNSKLHSVR